MTKKEKNKISLPAVIEDAGLKETPVTEASSFEVAVADLDSFGGGGGGVVVNHSNNTVMVGMQKVELKNAGHLRYLFENEVHKNLSFNFNENYSHSHKRSSVTNLDIEKAEYAVINDTIFILLCGGAVNIRDVSELWDSVTIGYIEEGDVQAGTKPIIILHKSKIEFRWSGSIKGSNFLTESHVIVNGGLSLTDTKIKNFGIHGDQVTISQSTLECGNITSKNILVKSSLLNTVTLSSKNSIYIENYSKYHGSRGEQQISGTPSQAESITIKPNHSLYMVDFAIPRYCRNRDVKFDINICSRLDYGRFSATGALKFVRCNEFDLLVDGVFIDSQKFAQAAIRLRSELGETERNNYGSYVPTLVPYLDTSRLTNEDYKEITGLIWELSLGYSLHSKGNTDYVPDRENKVQNTLILGLIDQIAARINLYKQINFLVN